ncbi:MAG: PQQ-like beta-propeller repeat protein, partial [Verrucomicrobiota bacterium]|nr:PQQ-like beta-propeller repeat protein [Verrucomicrobiota bacterium]
QWRGPNRDAVITESNRPLNALPAQPKTLWKIKVGVGQAAPVVAGSRLVLMDAQNGQETAHCVDTLTGARVWSVPIAPVVQFQNNYGDGPRCTPLIDGDNVYVQSCSGEFRCLALADGETLWSVNFETDYGATFFGNKGGGPEAKETASRRHGNNGSAAIDGDRIFVPVGSPDGATLVAYDKKSGKELWRAGKDNTAYASVMVGTLAGVRQAVHFTADALMGVEVANGKILWRVPLKTGAKRHVCTPVVSGDTVTVSSTTIGTLKFRIVNASGNFKAEQVWANLPLKTIIATPVLVGSHLFTLGPGARTDFVCVDFETGETLWSQPGFGDYASIMAVNDKLLALNSTGELFLIKANLAKYEELGRLQVCGKTWASPAYVNGTLFVKDDTSLSALVLAE